MPTHALRKSVGPWSAGTAVDIISNNHDGTYTVEILAGRPNEKAGVEFEDLVFDIEADYIVELRPRTREDPKNNRRERRAGMRKAEEFINSMMDKS